MRLKVYSIFINFSLLFSQQVLSVDNFECGAAQFTSSFIIGGQGSEKGQWPWLVSLFLTKDKEFICGASLISNQHLLSAAHCFETISFSSDVYALLGRYNLKNDNERDFIKSQIASITIHDEYGKADQKGDADIAVLKMTQSVIFTRYIKPVCLPSATINLENVVGTVVGYGKSEKKVKHEITPKHVELKTVGIVDCLLSDAAYRELASKRNFCAGGDGMSPCRGDSGGGFFIENSKSHRWTIYGVVSQGIIIGSACDVSKYVVFVDLNNFINWIQSVIATDLTQNDPCNPSPCSNNENCIKTPLSYDCTCKDGYVRSNPRAECLLPQVLIKNSDPCQSSSCGANSRCSVSNNKAVCLCLPNHDGNPPNCRRKTTEMPTTTQKPTTSFRSSATLSCDFYDNKGDHTGDTYNCAVKNLEIFSNGDVEVTSAVGKHQPSKSNAAVRGVFIRNGFSKNFPKGIEKIFKNLQALEFSFMHLSEIHQSDLKPLEKLKILYLQKNELKTIEKDLFKFNGGLRVIWLNDNQINYIDGNVFDHLNALWTLYLANNNCGSTIRNLNTQHEVKGLVRQIQQGKCINRKLI